MAPISERFHKLPCTCEISSGATSLAVVEENVNTFLKSLYDKLECASIGACHSYRKRRKGGAVGSWRIDIVATGQQLRGDEVFVRQAVTRLKGKLDFICSRFIRITVICTHVHLAHEI